jgi:hypothetical protein
MAAYLTVEQLSARLGGVPSVGTLNNWRSMVNKGQPNPGPAFVKLGKHVKYPLAEVERWEASRLKGANDNTRDV